jgi:hypothetical protein
VPGLAALALLVGVEGALLGDPVGPAGVGALSDDIDGVAPLAAVAERAAVGPEVEPVRAYSLWRGKRGVRARVGGCRRRKWKWCVWGGGRTWCSRRQQAAKIVRKYLVKTSVNGRKLRAGVPISIPVIHKHLKCGYTLHRCRGDFLGYSRQLRAPRLQDGGRRGLS